MRSLNVIIGTVFVVVLPLCSLLAQGGGVVVESSAGNFFGIGGRAAAMGEAVVVSVMDGSAIFYNPAGLTRIKRPEFYAALSNEKMKSQTDWSGLQTAVSSESDLSRTRLNALDLSVPVPTYRGSLVVAFGVNRTKSFDRVFNFRQPGRTALEEASGGIREWSAAAAVELSPRLAVGGTLSYLRGSESYYWNYSDESVQYIDNMQSNYSAFGVRVGLTMEANPYLTFGFTIDAPTRFYIKQDYVQRTITSTNDDETVGTYEYDLSHPFVFAGGVAFRWKALLLETDLGYADWSQLEYKDVPSLDSMNQMLHHAYSDVLQYRFGGEFTLPRYGIVLRGGYKHDPLPFSGVQLSNQIEKDRNAFSFGIGILIDRLVMLDLGYVHTTYEVYDGPDRLSEKFISDKVMVSVGYRI
jgi:long-subunit fatty acid transport protein